VIHQKIEDNPPNSQKVELKFEKTNPLLKNFKEKFRYARPIKKNAL
jgi:hypothetical protein